MKRKEFIKAWTLIRKVWLRNEVNSGRMRLSEGLMAQADLPKEAVRLWGRKRVDWNLTNTSPFDLIRSTVKEQAEVDFITKEFCKDEKKN